jgi:hypothetical protein
VSFDLFDKGRGVAGEFVLVDRHTGQTCPETIYLPGKIWYPASSQPGYNPSFVGHFFAVGGTGAVHGLSLLERKAVWTTALSEVQGIRDLVRVGPAGPGFLACQCRGHLFVLDPADGKVKWHRDDLEPQSGLMGDYSPGIIGDSQVLVVFASQGTHYTLYDTATGDQLRRGRLDILARSPRRAYGRQLFHFTAAAPKEPYPRGRRREPRFSLSCAMPTSWPT